ncbi:hypothetical protein DW979_10215 [Eubacterium sp. AM49-13BH]|nr:hypothetical protein DW979_10215 [Eubacterium sp. AM49-13BH]
MYVVLMYFCITFFWIDTYYDGSGRMTYFMEDKCMEWRQEKDMPVFMYIFLNKIENAEEARWTEKEKNEGYKTYKKLLELTEDDSSDVIKKCLRIIKETRHIVEYELWNKIVYFMTDYINGETVWG